MSERDFSKDWDLLARYLAEECTDQEQKEIRAWEKADLQHQMLLQSLEALWRVPESEQPVSDVEILWEKTAHAAGIADNTGRGYAATPPSPPRKAFAWLRFPQSPLRRFAYGGALAVLVMLPYFIWKNYRTSIAGISTPESEIHTLFVSNGDTVELSLSDGTRVTLDSGSSFQYPERFGDRIREVYLDGEALFEVPSDKRRPFVVVAQDTRIHVLGTRFNVRAWERTRSVEVAVDLGSVSFSLEQENAPAPMIIPEGYSSRIDQGQPPTEPEPVDMGKYLGWLRREADFQNVRVSEILSQLERWYDIKFVLLDKSIAFEQLTVFIDSRPIDEILELIAALTTQTFERSGSLVVLGPKNRD